MTEPETTVSLWLDREWDAYHDVLPADGRFDDIVVGGGLTGLTTALLLARAGRRVGVLEARSLASTTTGHSTAKVTLLQGTKLSRVLRRQGSEVASAYLDANREGAAWLLRFCEDHGVDVEQRDAVTFAEDERQLEAALDEYEAASSLGLPVTWADSLDVPFPVAGAVVLADQAQVDPVEVVHGLARQLREHGGTIHEDARVTGLEEGPTVKVTLADGHELIAEHVVLATGIPIVDRGLHFAKVVPGRSYVVALEGAQVSPGMYLSAGEPTHSVRDALQGERLLVSGEGHVTGRVRSERAQLRALRDWSARFFPDAEETHLWSAQDYSSYADVPLVGQLPGAAEVHVATGFDKWGMTNAVVAAHTVAAQTLGGVAPGLKHRTWSWGPLERLARFNLEAAAETLRDWRPAARCTHLGGPLEWNDAECSWDCRLHGSRFSESGEVLEGPARQPLPENPNR